MLCLIRGSGGAWRGGLGWVHVCTYVWEFGYRVRYSNISKRLKRRGCGHSFECGHGRGYGRGRGEAAIRIPGKLLKSNYF